MSRELITAIQQMAGTYQNDKVHMLLCTVTAVNEDNRTCDVESVNGDATLSFVDVELMVGVNDGMLLIPAVDSQVYIAYSNVVSPYVTMYSELDKIIYITGNSGIEITDGSIKFNNGSFGGLVKIEDLVNKLNTIEQDLNTLKTVFSGWTPVANDGGAALKAAAATWYAQQLTTTTVADLENDSVTHGSEL